jgi:hypothetical protein
MLACNSTLKRLDLSFNTLAEVNVVAKVATLSGVGAHAIIEVGCPARFLVSGCCFCESMSACASAPSERTIRFSTCSVAWCGAAWEIRSGLKL